MKKIYVLLMLTMSMVMFGGCASSTSGYVGKSTSENMFLGGKLAIGNTTYNIQVKDGADAYHSMNAIKNIK